MIFALVLLRRIAHLLQALLAIQRGAVDVDLRVEAMDVPVRGDDQRFDLKKRTVKFREELGLTEEQARELLDRPLKAEREGQLAALVWLGSDDRINGGA